MVVAERVLLLFLSKPLLGLNSKLGVGLKMAVILTGQESHCQRIFPARIPTRSGFEVVKVSRLVQLRRVDVGPELPTALAKVDVILLAEEMY